MLTLNEYIEIQEHVNTLVESEQSFFTDEQIDQAAYYDLKFNPVSFMTVLSLHNEAGETLASVDFEDADVAIAYIEDTFDLEDGELEYLDSYAWANEAPTDNTQEI